MSKNPIQRWLTRERRKRILYFLLGAGIIAVSFLCVFASTLLFAAQEDALFDGDHYIAVNIISAENPGRPLSLPARLDLYLQALDGGSVGKARAPGRDELSEAAAQAQAGSLWEAILHAHVPEGAKGFPTGDTPDELTDRAQTRQVLRDFYAQDSGAALSLWVVQVYAQNRAGEQVLLSVLLDSRTGDPYYIEFVGFAAVSAETKQAGLAAICGSFGITSPDLTSATSAYETESQAILTLSLTEEISIRKRCYYGVQCVFELVFG